MWMAVPALKMELVLTSILIFPAGLGLSFNLQPSLTIIGKYFQVRRPIANGIAMAGSPVFLCTLAPLNQFLFERFGWRGSFFILGAMLMNCCVAGSLMRPLNDGRAFGYLADTIPRHLRRLDSSIVPFPAYQISLIVIPMTQPMLRFRFQPRL